MLFFLALSLSLSLSFSPHGADTTVPSALHLFNKDLLCSRTLIQNTHTHTSRLPLVADRGKKEEKEEKKNSEGCGIGNACRFSLSTRTLDGREERVEERVGWHTEVGMPITASSASVWHTRPR